ncbi:MAG: metallophosphoesterase [Chloroflexota bacterium]
MNIALFADVHGRILLSFKLCARWERETGEHIELILQAGDLGAFPDMSRLDRATIKYAQKDPTELGFMHDFAEYRQEVAAVLEQTTCNMVFVRGNHEDHVWLDQLEQQTKGPVFPVDAYQRVYCLKTGMLYSFCVDGVELHVLGIGRIGAPDGLAERDATKYLQAYEFERLCSLDQQQIDLLLTHDSAKDCVTLGYGMAEIREVLNTYRPTYHFYGHTGQPYVEQRDTNGQTLSGKLSDLTWGKAAEGYQLLPCSMGILRWNGPDDYSFEPVTQSWFGEYTAHTWQHL